MAKCIRCGRGGMGVLHQAIRLNDKSLICFKCYKELGFKPLEDITAAPLLYSWNDIKDGKEAYLARASRTTKSDESYYSYKIVGTAYKNENGADIQKILKNYIEANSYDEPYFGMTNKDIKDEGQYDERIYQYEPVNADAELIPTEYNGDPAVKVMLIDEESDPVHIGWIAAEKAQDVIDMIGGDPILTSAEIRGGKYKFLNLDDKVKTGEVNFGGLVKVPKKD